VLRAAVVVIEAGALPAWRDGVRAHRAAARRAAQHPAREGPEPPAGVRGPLVVLDGFSRSVHPLPRDAVIGNRHGHPLAARLPHLLVALAVDPLAVGPDLGDLAHLSAAAVEPPDAIGPPWIQPGGDVRAYELCYLFTGVGAVDVVEDHSPQSGVGPEHVTARREDTHALQLVLNGVERRPFGSQHLEDPSHDGHPLRIHQVVVASVVVHKAVGAARARYDLPLARPPKLSPARALCSLSPLVAAELVEDAIGELALRGVVAPVVQDLS
jgi:hypothetical protein